MCDAVPGEVALMYAARFGHCHCLEALLQAGANKASDLACQTVMLVKARMQEMLVSISDFPSVFPEAVCLLG